jgi:hypothetical protein
MENDIEIEAAPSAIEEADTMLCGREERFRVPKRLCPRDQLQLVEGFAACAARPLNVSWGRGVCRQQDCGKCRLVNLGEMMKKVRRSDKRLTLLRIAVLMTVANENSRWISREIITIIGDKVDDAKDMVQEKLI